MPLFEISLVISELIALYLLRYIWQSGDILFFKISYSIIAIIPFLDPLFIFWITNMPSRQAEIFQDQQRLNTDVLNRWKHVLDEKNPQRKFRFWRNMIEMNKNDDS
ncbi:hypothetical protein [Methyloglobulus sp.]|uniref:hypothetical protein n=1 Tax=Methyloglobulus sp. TaxID=2518622 RepID=UPI00181F4CE3|nr:hypothetical protein [Methyloglobulus sp.]